MGQISVAFPSGKNESTRHRAAQAEAKASGANSRVETFRLLAARNRCKHSICHSHSFILPLQASAKRAKCGAKDIR